MPINPASDEPTAPDAPDAVLDRKYVRVIERSGNGLVVFEFSIGWPELVVEMALPEEAFDVFCGKNAVVRLVDGPRGSSEIQPLNHLDGDDT
jgi:phenol hydroxylase P0 protein